MKEVRIIGTVKGAEVHSKNTTIQFVPDRECAASYKNGKDTLTYAVLMPVREEEEGYVFAYKKAVKMSVKNSPITCALLSPQLHCELVLCETSAKNPQVVFLETSLTKKSFTINQINFNVD